MTIKQSEDKWAWIMERAAHILTDYPDFTVMMGLTVAWNEHELIYGSSVQTSTPVGILGYSPLESLKRKAS